MDSLLRDPAVGVIVAIIFGVAGLIASVIAIRVSHRKKKLGYAILPMIPVVAVPEWDKQDIKVTFKDIPVTDAYLLRVFIANTGNLAISDSDFWRPVKISVEPGARVLTAHVANSFPKRLRTALTYDETNVEVGPLLLNEGDWLEVNVLVENYRGGVSVDGHVNGVARISRLDSNMIVLKRVVLPNVRVFLPLFSLASLIAVAYMLVVVELPLPTRVLLLTLFAVNALLGIVSYDMKSSKT